MERLRKFGRYSTRVLNRFKPKDETENEHNFNFETNFKEEKFSVSWRIENIHRCVLKCQEYLESPAFSTKFGSEVKWTLRIYPRGRDKIINSRLSRSCDIAKATQEECETVGLFIYRASTNPVASSFRCVISIERNLKENISYPIFLDSSKNSVEIKIDSTVSTEYGTDNFICSKYLNFPQTIIVKCDVYVTSVYNKEASGNYSAGLPKSCSIFQDLKDLYENGKFSDITLKVKDVQIPAHKAILASRSRVFDAMFQHNMKEAQTNVVEVENIDPAILRDFLQYIYTGNVDDFSIEKALFLYPVADRYFLDGLKEWCVDIMLASLSIENVCQVAVLADLHPDVKLKEAAFNMFRNYTRDIFQRKEWKDLIQDANRNALVSDILQAVSADFTTNCGNK